MTKKNNLIFICLIFVAWIIFTGLCVEAGALVVNFIFSVYRPEFVQNLYQKLDLTQMYNQSRVAFFSMYSFILVISILKCYLFYIVSMLISKLNLSEPFNPHVARQIRKISYYTLSIGLISYLGREAARRLEHLGFKVDEISQFWTDSQAFILMAAVIYIIATIFSRGVEIQHENDLTI